MTAFTKENLIITDSHIAYVKPDGGRVGFAWFHKHGFRADLKPFYNFLVKNFTWEEIKKGLDANYTASEIMEARGWVSLHPRRHAKKLGYKNPTPMDIVDILASTYNYTPERVAAIKAEKIGKAAQIEAIITA